MRVVDIINQAVAKAGLAEVDAVPNNLYTLALSFLNRKYETIWDAYPWRAEKQIGLSVSASAATLIFPQEVDTVMSLYTTDQPLSPLNEVIMARYAPSSFDDTASTPYNFFNKPDSPVAVQPTAATAITVLSDSASDTSKTVRLFGTVSDVETYEDITLNGTTPVAGSKSFTELTSISKPLTTGRITIRDSGANELGTIPAWAYKGAYRRIQLYPAPEAAITLYVIATRRFPRLTSDDDTIMLTKCEDALFSYLMSELYEYSNDLNNMQLNEAKGAQLLNVALDSERDRDSEDNRCLPAYGMFYDADSTEGYADPIHKTF